MGMMTARLSGAKGRAAVLGLFLSLCCLPVRAADIMEMGVGGLLD